MAEDTAALRERLRDRVLAQLRAKDVEMQATASAELAQALAQFEAGIEQTLEDLIEADPELLDSATEDELAEAITELFNETFGPVS